MIVEIDKQLAVLQTGKKELVLGAFAPIVKDLNDLGIQFPEIKKMPDSPEKSAAAKRFRIDLGKALCAADKTRAELKEESLKEGQAIQGVYNHIKTVTFETKEEAIKIEKHYELIEAARVAEIREFRLSLLSDYDVDGSGYGVENMDPVVWDNFLQGVKGNYDSGIQAAAAEAERQKAAAILEAERIAAMEVENEKLRIEAGKQEKARAREKAAADMKLKKERDAREKLEQAARDQQAAAAAEKKRLEDIERIKADASDIEKLKNLGSELVALMNGLDAVIARDMIAEIIETINNYIGIHQ